MHFDGESYEKWLVDLNSHLNDVHQGHIQNESRFWATGFGDSRKKETKSGMISLGAVLTLIPLRTRKLILQLVVGRA